MGMAAEGQGTSTSSTDSVTGTSVNTMFQLLRMCVVVKGDAAHSASQVTRSAFIVRSVLSSLECFGSSPSWIFRQWSMWRRFSLSCSHAWIDDLIANIADMAATSAAKENIHMWPRHKKL